MKRSGIILLLGIVVSLAACGGADTCEDPEFYEFAQGGKRIEAPDDLDDLAADRELVIPEVSPRPPRKPGAGCLDRPPTLKTD